MHLFAAFAALGLLVVVLFPFLAKRLRAARRGRAVHLDAGCHWYANYDEELRYEPKRKGDIVRVSRVDVLGNGYKPTSESQLVPRTFRHRVPGDKRVRLWRSDRDGSPALWLCEWAEYPVRVSIGAGDRERVPGVESISLAVGLLEAKSVHSHDEVVTPIEPVQLDAVINDDAAVESEVPERDDWSAIEEMRIEGAETADVAMSLELVMPERAGDGIAAAAGEQQVENADAGEAEGAAEAESIPAAHARKRKRRRRRK